MRLADGVSHPGPFGIIGTAAWDVLEPILRARAEELGVRLRYHLLPHRGRPHAAAGRAERGRALRHQPGDTARPEIVTACPRAVGQLGSMRSVSQDVAGWLDDAESWYPRSFTVTRLRAVLIRA